MIGNAPTVARTRWETRAWRVFACSALVGLVVLLVRAYLFDNFDTAFTNGDQLPRMLGARVPEAELCVGASVFVVVLMVFYGLARILRRWPELADIPNKHYWLAPERRSRTVSELRGWLYLFGLIVNLWIIGVTFVLDGRYRPWGAYNGLGDPSVEPFTVIAGCLLFTAPSLLLMALYIRRFSDIVEEGR